MRRSDRSLVPMSHYVKSGSPAVAPGNLTDRPDFRPTARMIGALQCPASRFARVNGQHALRVSAKTVMSLHDVGNVASYQGRDAGVVDSMTPTVSPPSSCPGAAFVSDPECATDRP